VEHLSKNSDIPTHCLCPPPPPAPPFTGLTKLLSLTSHNDQIDIDFTTHNISAGLKINVVKWSRLFSCYSVYKIIIIQNLLHFQKEQPPKESSKVCPLDNFSMDWKNLIPCSSNH